MSTYDVPRVTALETLANGHVLRLDALALWVAQERAGELRIIGGWRHPGDPVNLVKAYV